MAWWRKGWIGVLGSLFALAACSSDSSPSTTVALPSASTTRPAGFGGTLPAVTTSSVVVTTLLATTTAVSTTPVSTTDEAALRTRVLEYDRAFREELLHMPNPNYDRLRAFHVPDERSQVGFSDLESEVRAQMSYRLNSPDRYSARIERIEVQTLNRAAAVTLCVEDNIVQMAPGPDEVAGTEDDTTVNNEIGTNRYKDVWVTVEEVWLIDHAESSEKSVGATCASR